MNSGPLKRRWLRFSVRTLLVAITLICVWLGYQVRWMRQRQEGRDWLDSHGVGGAIMFDRELRPDLPWSLRIFGEKPLEKVRIIGALDDDRDDLPTYRKRVAEISALFPESQVVDIDAYDWSQ